jgi:hypothetical protein
MRNDYEITICCEEMGDLLIMGRARPIEFTLEGGTKLYVDLELLGDDDNGIITLKYCPNCGVKVQLRRLPNG